MAGHAQLKFVMTECSKTQIRLTGLNKLLYFLKLFCLFCHNIPGRALAIHSRYRCLNKNDEKVYFFRAGQCAALSSFRVRKNANFTEKGSVFFRA